MSGVTLFVSVAFALTALQGPQGAPPRDTDVQPTAGTASLSGVVVNDETPPRPVRRAIVTVAGPGLRPSRGAITDDAGRFTITGLPAGRVTITVARASFITSVYGAKRPRRPGTPVAIAEGQRLSDLVVRIWRGAAVAGVLRDEQGAPVDGVPVRAIPARPSAERTILTLTNNGVTTNALGEYRIFGLEPGAYVISANPTSGGTAPLGAMNEAEVDAALEALRRKTATAPAAQPPAPVVPIKPFDYAPIYYPGTPLLSQAAPVALEAGQEQTGLDFALQRVATATVSGAVRRPDGAPAASANVQLIAIQPSTPYSSGSPLVLNATSKADGTFLISQVTPGNYRLMARAPVNPAAAPPPPGTAFVVGQQTPFLWAQTEISIAGDDVSDVSVTLSPGLTISGRIVVSGTPVKPLPDFTKLRLSLLSTASLTLKPGTGFNSIASTQPATVTADGTFTISNIPPGTYRFSVGGPDFSDAGWVARSAIAGDRDLLDRDIEAARDTTLTGVVVAITDRHTKLSGRLQTPDGAPISDVFVVAFAADRTEWMPRGRRIQATRPGVDGQYSITDLPPGDYLIGAVTDIDQDDWQDPAVLERLVPASLKISIAEGEQKNQDLQLMSGGRNP
jgi:hypothetical protein